MDKGVFYQCLHVGWLRIECYVVITSNVCLVTSPVIISDLNIVCSFTSLMCFLNLFYLCCHILGWFKKKKIHFLVLISNACIYDALSAEHLVLTTKCNDGRNSNNEWPGYLNFLYVTKQIFSPGLQKASKILHLQSSN